MSSVYAKIVSHVRPETGRELLQADDVEVTIWQTLPRDRDFEGRRIAKTPPPPDLAAVLLSFAALIDHFIALLGGFAYLLRRKTALFRHFAALLCCCTALLRSFARYKTTKLTCSDAKQRCFITKQTNKTPKQTNKTAEPA